MTDLLNRICKLARIADRVLSYDNSIIATLPYILYEDHGISPFSSLGEHKSLVSIKEYFPASTKVRDLPKLIANSGITEFALESIDHGQDRRFDSWSVARIPNEGDNRQNHADVLKLQSNLGKGRLSSSSAVYDNKLDVDPEDYLYHVSTQPSLSLASRAVRRLFPKIGSARSWERIIHSLIDRNELNESYPSLSIGPRWSTEIQYFRSKFSLPMHIGLDLNGDADGLILEGDMHNTPFEDAQFQFVFIKNTVDKSYDIRRLVREIGRIVRPGGYVFVDQVCGQSACTPLTRTNIQKASNLLKLFNAWTGTKRVLLNKDISLASLPQDIRGDASNHSLLAIQL